MKKCITLLLTLALISSFGLFAIGSGESDENKTQDSGTVENTSSTGKTQTPGKADSADNASIGDYVLEIKSCRLAKDYEKAPVVIITYGFTNNGDDAASFDLTFNDEAFQNGVGLNKAYILADSANYNDDNQSKKIQKGSSLDIEVAYKLNDTSTDVVVEVAQLFSWDNTKISKTFIISE
ncbi:MAG: DUF5067 domain-containing protein [Clostridiales bacterium]|nr:DUF5067 domain-containing protein [Clostridiales bacterium]